MLQISLGRVALNTDTKLFSPHLEISGRKDGTSVPYPRTSAFNSDSDLKLKQTHTVNMHESRSHDRPALRGRPRTQALPHPLGNKFALEITFLTSFSGYPAPLPRLRRCCGFLKPLKAMRLKTLHLHNDDHPQQPQF